MHTSFNTTQVISCNSKWYPHVLHNNKMHRNNREMWTYIAASLSSTIFLILPVPSSTCILLPTVKTPLMVEKSGMHLCRTVEEKENHSKYLFTSLAFKNLPLSAVRFLLAVKCAQWRSLTTLYWHLQEFLVVVRQKWKQHHNMKSHPNLLIFLHVKDSSYCTNKMCRWRDIGSGHICWARFESETACMVRGV